MQRLRVAVIGAGLGAGPHLRSLQDLADEIEVVWVCARNAERLAGVALPSGARATTDLDAVFADTSLHAALVLTPPATHLDLVRRAAAVGLHVLVEKPLEIDLPRAMALVDACDAAGVTLGVVLQHRLREGAAALQRLVRAGALGTLVSASASVRWWRPQSYYDVPGRGTYARDGGGVLITQAIHTLDVLLCCTGMPRRLTACTATSPLHRMQAEDTAAVLMQFAGGAMAVLQATTAACPGYPERIELNGTLATATLEAGALHLAYADGRVDTLGAAQSSGGGADPMDFDHAAHRALLQDFVHAVRAGTAPVASGRSALAVQRVLAAVAASAAMGAAVDLDLQGAP